MNATTTICVVILALLPVGCTCEKDVTDDSAYKFGSLREHLFETRRPLMLYTRGDGGGPLTLSVSQPSQSGILPTTILPSGTLLRPIQLTGDTCKSGSMVVVVRIENGTNAGRKAIVESADLFLDPNQRGSTDHPTVVQWEANPIYLEAARQ